jgi:hypothetical protein
MHKRVGMIKIYLPFSLHLSTLTVIKQEESTTTGGHLKSEISIRLFFFTETEIS